MQLVLSHVDKSYSGVPVLQDISLTIAAHDALLVTGPSGIGKTTLLRILTGQEPPDDGTVRVLNDDGTECQNRCHFGVDFQEDRLLEKLSAIENVALVVPSRNRGHRQLRDYRQMIREELSELLPSDALVKPVSELSGGMRRRVCIVRAMILPKDVYVLDEPFTGLDTAARQNCIQYIRAHQGTAPIVMTAHDLTGLSWMREIRL